jgi:hypothetical protein
MVEYRRFTDRLGCPVEPFPLVSKISETLHGFQKVVFAGKGRAARSHQRKIRRY